MSNQQVLSDYVYEMVNTLIGSGVKHAVVSPGSRSTPLAYAFAHVDAIQMHRQVDERAAAFYALGLAKAKKGAGCTALYVRNCRSQLFPSDCRGEICACTVNCINSGPSA